LRKQNIREKVVRLPFPQNGGVLKKLSALLSASEGQAILEFAVMLPVFVLIGFLLVDTQWAMKDAANLDYISTETARCEAIQSFACIGVNTPQSYATALANNARLDLARLTIDTPSCDLIGTGTCTVTVAYRFKALGMYFPSLTITRVGTAAIR
jgi:Flp pilus assembly protein TadG